MTPKECLIQFKEAYCEKNPKFRCDKCLFRQDNNYCLINAFISRQCDLCGRVVPDDEKLSTLDDKDMCPECQERFYNWIRMDQADQNKED